MQKVPKRLYKDLNWGLMALSLLFVVGFIVRDYIDFDLSVVGVNMTVFVFAVIHLVYSAGLFFLVKRKSLATASLISLVIFMALNVALIQTTGQLQSIYHSLWAILIFPSTIFGPIVPFGMAFMYGLYLIVLAPIGNVWTVSNISILIGDLLVATLSFFFWRNYYTGLEGDSRFTALKSKLGEEQLKSQTLINSIGDGVMVIDKSNQIQLFNPAAANLTGWKQEDAVGLDYHSVFKLFNENNEKIEPNENPFVQAMTKKQSIINNSIILQTLNDKQIILSLIVSPLSDASEEVTGAIAVFRDVSAEKIAERQRSEFISTASHEMRTPVAAIEGYLALAMNPKVSNIDEKAREYLNKAHESTQHLGQLFKDLLSAAKSEDGRLSNHPIAVEMNQFLRKIAEDVRFTVEKKGLVLEYQDGSSASGAQSAVQPLIYTHIDPERIREVIDNLVSNAVKFTEEGKITISISSTETSVTIGIHDTGIGIPEEDIPHLFQKFYRVDNSATRTIGGTGLGLFISRNIVELYDGKIWVESEYGKGSHFYISLPRITAEQAQELQKQESDGQQLTQQTTQPNNNQPAPQPQPVVSTPQTMPQTPQQPQANTVQPNNTQQNTTDVAPSVSNNV